MEDKRLKQLDMALRIAGLPLQSRDIDLIFRIDELVEKKKGKTSIDDIVSIQFQSLNLSPESMFRRVARVEDVLGSRFVSVIHYGDWYTNIDVAEAHRILKEREPELFDL